MEEAELEKQRRMVTKSSNKRKPFSNLTNVIRKPNHTVHTYSFSQSKKPGSSTASDSSVGTTQSRIHAVPSDHPLPSTPQRLTRDHLVGDENHLAYARRWSAQTTRSNVKDAVQETRSNGKGNQSCLDKTTNDGKGKSVVLQCSSMEKIKDKREAIDVPFSAHHMKNAKTSMDALIPHSTVKIKDKVKEKDVQSNSSMRSTNINTSFIMPPLLKRKDKGKAIAVPPDYPPVKKVKNNMVEVRVPLSGVKIKDRGETDKGSSRVDLAQKDKGKAIATPISYRTLGKKDKRSVEEYALPQDFVEQQRAYFQEIDEFELQVEEV
ncbi:hypothetical protein Ccrd_016861 [Cynara cardunculus var. scolymus]|uniref:Sororin C-terminal region domain-containing protein n=1 Tax=Cynara cardunculus var. scolymus TaxID=59895 RepID=A0A103Y948_CYNCS|nr:hypothetical protein Ccrd_016861 [Cynara cardunculus var. scolymus]